MAHPNYIQRASELLSKLPGIGPRQALRIAYTLAEKETVYRNELSEIIEKLGLELSRCNTCFRVMQQHNTLRCDLCRSPNRNKNKILIIEKEQDVEQIERADIFNGLYHVTGGTISPLDKSPGDKLRLRELFNRIKTHQTRSELEVIVATSNTLEGNQTAAYIERILQPLEIKITRFGRGLSTGAEIEYADPLTLEAAFKNRR
jgi:recombination protein RecR